MLENSLLFGMNIPTRSNSRSYVCMIRLNNIPEVYKTEFLGYYPYVMATICRPGAGYFKPMGAPQMRFFYSPQSKSKSDNQPTLSQNRNGFINGNRIRCGNDFVSTSDGLFSDLIYFMTIIFAAIASLVL